MNNKQGMLNVERRRRFVLIVTVLFVFVCGSKSYGQAKRCIDEDRYQVFPAYLDRGTFNFIAFDNDKPPEDTDSTISGVRVIYDNKRECLTVHNTSVSETFRFFREGDDELYRRLEAGTTISNAFIENLDINRLMYIDSSSGHAFVNARIDIRRSIIGNFDGPMDESDYFESVDSVTNEVERKPSFDSTIFRSKVVLRNSYLPWIELAQCVFKDSVIFLRNFHSEDVTIDNSTFESYVMLYQSGSLEFGNRLPHDVFSEYYSIDTSATASMPAINITYSAVKAPAYIYNSHPYRSFNFKGTTFRDNVSLNRFNMRGQGFGNYRSTDYLHLIPTLRNRPQIRNIDLTEVRFWKTVNIENVGLVNINFNKTRFLDSLIFYQASIYHPAVIDSTNKHLLTTKYGRFRRAFFQDQNVFIVEPPDFRFADYGFNFASIKQLRIPFVVKGEFNLDEHENAVEFYYNLASETQAHFNRNEELRDELTRRWEHEETITEIRYFRENMFTPFSNFFKYSWYSFLEAVVGNGYQGENRFFITVMSFVLFFAVVYFLGFNREITYLLSKIENEDPPQYVTRKYNLVTFVKCLWVSFYVFITPKFAASFFHQQRSFFFWLLAEWIIGVSLIVLFLVFIASNYSFVKALIGL